MKSNNLIYNIYYDEEADFLEVFIGEPSECYAEEVEKGVFIRKDKTTNEIKSIGIFSFRKRAQLLRDILDKNNLQMSLEIGII